MTYNKGENMNLYKITLEYGYHDHYSIDFFVVAKSVGSAVDVSIKRFKGYNGGDCKFKHAEVIASEDWDTLLIAHRGTPITGGSK